MDEPLDTYFCNPESIEGETFRTYDTRTGGGVVMTMAEHIEERFGIMDPPNPARKDPTLNWTSAVIGPPHICLYFDAIPMREAQVPVLFDLDYPIDAQLLKAKGQLKTIRDEWECRKSVDPFGDEPFPNTKNRRVRAENYPMYLRLLDAEAIGNKTSTVAAALLPKMVNTWEKGYPASRKTRENLRAARALRDGAYRQIVR